jgi:hypothetical protein
LTFFVCAVPAPIFFSCFRNPHHFKEFKHEHLAALVRASLADEGTAANLPESQKEQLNIYSDVEQVLNRRSQQERKESIEEKGKPATTENPGNKKSPTKAVAGKRARSADPEDGSAPTTASKKMAPSTKSRIEARLEAAAPYNFLLTKVKDNLATHNDNHR